MKRPQCKVTIDGKDIAMEPGIASVVITRALNRIPLAEVVIYDGNPGKQEFPLSEEARFTPGKSIVKIEMGNTEFPIKTVFTGIILGQSIKAPLDSPSTMKLELRDPIIASTVIRKNRYFPEANDSSIISQIMQDYDPAAIGTIDGSVTHKEMVQYNSTDWDFILSRAEANGLFVTFVEADSGTRTINVAAPVFSPAGPVTLTYGTDIVEFEAGLSARDQLASVKSQFWKYTDQAAKDGEASANDGDVQGTIKSTTLADVLGGKPYIQQTYANLEDEEVTTWSEAKLMRSRLSKVQGRVRVYGRNDVNPGDVITLKGVGTTYGPDAFVCEVIHSMSATSTWYTDIKFGYDDDWFYERHNNIMDKSAAGLIPGIQGLVCGTVKDIVDPDGEYRVKVNIPFVNVTPEGAPNADGVWARIVSADAGSGKRGILIRPEVDDEVIVGFVNNDPRDPVILGMVYSSSKNAVPDDLAITADNITKGWITLAETKFLIDDTKDKAVITVETKNKNTIVISDADKSILIQDEHGNIIEMKKDLITITAKKDFKLDAGGKVDITAKDNITITSKKKVTAKGTSGTEVSASGGNTVIKGTQVQIN